MNEKNLQDLLRQLSQERGIAVALKKKKEEEFLLSLKQGLKEFIECFRETFYPLINDNEIDPSAMGTYIEIVYLIEPSTKRDPKKIHLELIPIYRTFRIKIIGFMTNTIIFEEATGDNLKEIELKSDYDLKKYAKEFYKLFVEDKEETINKVYKTICNNILKYNQKTLNIMKDLK